jgi:phosphoglycolate phosphatase
MDLPLPIGYAFVKWPNAPKITGAMAHFRSDRPYARGMVEFGRRVASAPVVGFDLDMTLIDSRPGIAATYRALSAHTGVHVDADAAATRLGPPLHVELARWFAPDAIAAAGDRFRAIYPEVAIALSPLLPGALESFEAVRSHAGRVIVITGKYGPNAHLHLDHLGLIADAVVGWAWGPSKSAAMRAHGVDMYVGDHPDDMVAARSTVLNDRPVTAVGVTSDGFNARDLIAAGADVVLRDLTEFPDWLAAARTAHAAHTAHTAREAAGECETIISGT